MKKFVAAFGASATLLLTGVGATAAHADPTATTCYSVSATVNGQPVVAQADCATLPPQ